VTHDKHATLSHVWSMHSRTSKRTRCFHRIWFDHQRFKPAPASGMLYSDCAAIAQQQPSEYLSNHSQRQSNGTHQLGIACSFYLLVWHLSCAALRVVLARDFDDYPVPALPTAAQLPSNNLARTAIKAISVWTVGSSIGVCVFHLNRALTRAGATASYCFATRALPRQPSRGRCYPTAVGRVQQQPRATSY
jgi:hypothetical protein